MGKYYVWTGEGDCDNCTENIEQAKRWCNSFPEDMDSYVTNEGNEVVYISGKNNENS